MMTWKVITVMKYMGKTAGCDVWSIENKKVKDSWQQYIGYTW